MTNDVLASDNPFAAPSDLPFGLPDFGAIRIEHFRPAIEAGLSAQRAEWDAVASDPADATVQNTLEALEVSGQLLARVLAVFFTLVSSAGNDELRAIEADYAPRFAEHNDALYLDERIFARLEQLDASAEKFDAETAWLLQTYRTRFVRAGIRLGEAEKAALRALNGELTTLETEFSQRVVKGMEAGAVAVASESELEGLAPDAVSALRQAAADRGAEGYLVTLQLPTGQGILSQTTNADLRERVLAASLQRGTGEHAESDTRAVLLDVARKRAERAKVLGYAHHSAYVAEDGTAKTTEAINEMLHRLAAPAVRNARAEAEQLQAALEADRPGAALTAADWSIYADKVRESTYAFDESTLRPYLELDRVINDGVFFAANRVYGLEFEQRDDLAGYADGVRVYEVREADGTPLGLFVADYYAREGKRGGAWMHHLVNQSGLLGRAPVVVNNLNITRPAEGEPTLLTWDEVITCFHEFGHALHGLFSDVRYPTLSGTSVPRDFVEYPSQVNEMWAWHPQVLASFARHHATGEALAPQILDQLRASRQYGEGFATTEYLAAALLDQMWHQVTPDDVPTDAQDVEAFEVAALASAGLNYELVPPRYRSTYFNHTFGGGYDAGYYSYIWSEVLDADTVDWFAGEAAIEGDGGLNRAAGDAFRKHLLSRGYSQDPLASYRDLRGRDAVLEPLLVRRGLEG